MAPDAIAVAVNVTAAGGGRPGFVTGFAAGSDRPDASTLNTDAVDQIRGAGTILPVSASGFAAVRLGGGDVVVDVTGWFTGASAPDSQEGLFVAEAPIRLTDTRLDSGRIPAGERGSSRSTCPRPPSLSTGRSIAPVATAGWPPTRPATSSHWCRR